MPIPDTRAVVMEEEEELKAAAGCYDELTGSPGRTNPDEMRGDWLTRHFVRHRIAAEARVSAREEVLREALIWADLKIRSYPGADQSDVEIIRAALHTDGAGS